MAPSSCCSPWAQLRASRSRPHLRSHPSELKIAREGSAQGADGRTEVGGGGGLCVAAAAPATRWVAGVTAITQPLLGLPGHAATSAVPPSPLRRPRSLLQSPALPVWCIPRGACDVVFEPGVCPPPGAPWPPAPNVPLRQAAGRGGAAGRPLASRPFLACPGLDPLVLRLAAHTLTFSSPMGPQVPAALRGAGPRLPARPRHQPAGALLRAALPRRHHPLPL